MKILLLLTLLLFVSCRRIEEGTTVVGNARHLLNQGRYEESIAYLKKNTQPSTREPEQRILLASAYAGSVGLNLVESYPAFEHLFFKEALLNRTMSQIGLQVPVPLISNNSEAEKELIAMIDGLMSAGKVIFGLQWIPPEKRGRILLAAKELDGIHISDPQYRSAAVYKMIIFSDLFMSTLRETLVSPSKIFESPMRFFCEINIARFAESMGRLQVGLELLSSASDQIVSMGGKNPVSLQKLTDTFSRIKTFFDRNRSAVNVGQLMHGVVRNELCK